MTPVVLRMATPAVARVDSHRAATRTSPATWRTRRKLSLCLTICGYRARSIAPTRTAPTLQLRLLLVERVDLRAASILRLHLVRMAGRDSRVRTASFSSERSLSHLLRPAVFQSK